MELQDYPNVIVTSTRDGMELFIDMSASRIGGYDHDFFTNIAPKYTCLICMNIQREPTIVSCCGQHFCNSCINMFFSISGVKCPHCLARDICYFVDKQQVREIQELQVYCSNRHRGCKWHGKFELLQKHVNSECERVTVYCSNGCGKKVEKCMLDEHLRSHCSLGRCEYEWKDRTSSFGCVLFTNGEILENVPCITGSKHQDGGLSDLENSDMNGCNSEEKSKIMTEDHEDTTNQCPNGCSERVNYRDLEYHFENCPLEQVRCPFSDVGCKANVARCDLETHLEVEIQDHLRMMTKAHENLKEKMTGIMSKDSLN